MARGFLSGLIWGAVVSGAILVVASKVADFTSLTQPTPDVEAVDLPEGSGFQQNRPESQPNVPQTETRPEGDASPAPVAPQAPTATAPVADTTPAPQPEASMPEAGLQAPVIGAESDIAVAREDAVLPTPAAAPPVVPSTDLAPVPESDVTPEAETSPVTDIPPSTLPGAPQGLRLPVPEIENLAPGVSTDRLPRIGAADRGRAGCSPATACAGQVRDTVREF